MSYIFITGGASSGKSSFALNHFKGRKDITFIATGIATDPEMRIRIQIHRSQRPKEWETIEEPCHLLEAVKKVKRGNSGVIIDCITFWVSNLLCLNKMEQNEIVDCSRSTALYLKGMEKTALVVSNEVGFGIIPHTELGRTYRRIVGEVNQVFAHYAHSAYLLASGIAIQLK